MTEQSQPVEDEDVEGHVKKFAAATEDDDVQGHVKARMSATEDEDDVAGHVKKF